MTPLAPGSDCCVPGRTALALLFLLLLAGAQAQLCGDCDESGAVTITDALAAAQHAVSITMLAGLGLANCDVNETGAVDVLDSLVIAQFAAGLPVSLSCLAGGQPGTCGAPIQLTSGVPYVGSTLGGADALTAGCGFFAASERVHFIASVAASFSLSGTLTAGFPAVLYVYRNGCLTGELACDNMSPYTFNIGGTAGTYYIVVDGSAAGAAGEGIYTLTVTIN